MNRIHVDNQYERGSIVMVHIQIIVQLQTLTFRTQSGLRRTRTFTHCLQQQINK